MKPFVIAVNAVSGGGKTTLAHALRSALPATLFSFDDFDAIYAAADDREAVKSLGGLPIGFAPDHGGRAVFSIVLYPRWVRFFFLQGAALEDPHRRLEGTGKQVRSIRLDDEAVILDDPYIRNLMDQALKAAGSDLKTGRSPVILKSKLTRPRE